jgi:hypothetical protein
MSRCSTVPVDHQWRPMELKLPLGHWPICIYRYSHLIWDYQGIIQGIGDKYDRNLVNIYDIRTWTKLKTRGTTIITHAKTTHMKTTTTMGQGIMTKVEGGYLTIRTCRRESVCRHNSLLRQTEGRIIEKVPCQQVRLLNMLHPATGPGSKQRGTQSTMLLVLPPTYLLISDVSLLNSSKILTLTHELLFNVHFKGHQMLIDPA